MAIIFKEVNKKEEEFQKVKDLYLTAFPANERFPMWLLWKKARQNYINFYNLYDDDKWIGFIYIVLEKDISLIAYLAIHSKERGSGYGSQVLKAVIEKYKKNRIVLNIEPLDEKAENYEERKKRRKFYEKNGFQSLGYTVREWKEDYDMFSYGGIVTKEEYETLMKKFIGKFLFQIVKY